MRDLTITSWVGGTRLAATLQQLCLVDIYECKNTQDIYFFPIYFTDVGITGVRQSAYRYGTRPCLASSQLVGRNVDVK